MKRINAWWLALPLTACGGREPVRDANSGAPVEVISGAPLVNPQALVVVDEWLVIADAGDSALKVFNRHTGTLTAVTGRRGAGPGEFRQIWSLQAKRSATGAPSVWAFDNRTWRLTGYAISPKGTIGELLRPVQLQESGAPLSLQWVSDSSLALVGFLCCGRFALVDTAGHISKWLGVVPIPKAEMLGFAAQQALQPTMSVRPDGGAIAIAARYAGRVDIYSTSTGAMTPAEVPLPFDPDMLASASRGEKDTVTIFRSNDQTRFGYVSITANTRHIYALFSGRTRAETPGRANFGRQVHVFAWDGSLQGQIDLPEDTYDLAVDSGDSILYTLRLEPEPAVYSVDLPHQTVAEAAPTPRIPPHP